MQAAGDIDIKTIELITKSQLFQLFTALVVCSTSQVSRGQHPALISLFGLWTSSCFMVDLPTKGLHIIPKRSQKE